MKNKTPFQKFCIIAGCLLLLFAVIVAFQIGKMKAQYENQKEYIEEIMNEIERIR